MNPLSSNDLQQMLDAFKVQGYGRAGPASALPVAVRPMSALGKMLAAPAADLTALKEALSYISPDVPRGTGTIIDPAGVPVSDYWFGVILAVRREYGEDAKESVRQWSQQSGRYDDAGFEHAWNQYKASHPNPISIGSFYMLAKANGWSGPSNAVVPAISGGGFKLLDREDIMRLSPLKWRVKGLFPEAGIGAIYGPSGSGKSFLSFDLGMAIASGAPWFGHRTTSCAVTYVMLEGEAGLRNRVKAWEVHNGSAVPSSFGAIAQPFQLSEPEQVEALVCTVPRGGVIIIDTLNRAAPGLDENSSQDMGRILAGMKRLQSQTGGLVLVVHHTGKDASKGLRGHSSLHAALDGALEVERSNTSRCWSAAKVKDGEDSRQIPFKLNVVDLGTDQDGDPITSCAAGPDAAAIFRPSPPSGANQKTAFAAIQLLLRTSSDTGRGGAGPQVPCVTFDSAVQAVSLSMPGIEKKRRAPRARDALQGLVSGGHLKRGLDAQEEEWLWL